MVASSKFFKSDNMKQRIASCCLLVVVIFNFNFIHGVKGNSLGEAEQESEQVSSEWDNLFEGDDFYGLEDGDRTGDKIEVVDDDEINDSIWNLDEYLTALEYTKNPSVPVKNSTLREFGSIEQYFESGRDNVKTSSLCTACKILVGIIVLHVRNHNATEKSIEEKINLICPLFRIASSLEVCYGLIERLIPTAYYVLKNRPQLKVEAFCGFALQQMGCNTDDPYLEWSLEMVDMSKIMGDAKPLRKPKIRTKHLNSSTAMVEKSLMRSIGKASNETDNETATSTDSSTSTPSSGPSDKPVKILQLADLHIDLFYKFKAPEVCQQRILCCRNNSDKPTFEDGGSAGMFGSGKKCDPPMSLLELTLQHIVKQHPDIELVYMTGDIVPHNIWSSTNNENFQTLIQASALLSQYFTKVQVIPMVGNHEPHPVNFYSSPGAPEELDTRMLYNISYDSWKQWIPDDQKNNYFTEGFYTVEHSETLKLVALNTNVCYGFNFWGMYEVKDPGGQLQWLVQELEKSEAKKQSVHIIGHVPPGHPDCNKVWSRNFYNIVSRYSSTIKAQFYGHTHYDELKILYSSTERGVAMNPLYISPSLTPYDLHNPAYKLFFADRKTWDIVDYETWVFDLEEANKTPEELPKWFMLYRATEAYGIPNTRIENMGALIDRMAEDKQIFDVFYQYYKKALPRQKENATVYKQKQILCGIVMPYFKEEEECNRMQEKVDGQVVSIPVYY